MKRGKMIIERAGASFSITLISLMTFQQSAKADIAMCYAYEFQSRDYGSPGETYFTDINLLKVIEIENDRIKFYHKQAGGNFHLCSVPGFAKKVSDDSYVFIDQKEFWSEKGWEGYDGYYEKESDRCALTFTFDSESVTITPKGTCRSFCGARAAFGGKIKVARDPSLCKKGR